MFRGMVVSSLALLLAGVAGSALAEDAATPVSELVVTGEKTARPLQQTVTSVRVFTAQQIRDENLIDVYDAVERTANVASNLSREGFTIRGIDAFSVSGAGTGLLATVYLDGAALPRTAIKNGPLDLWDLSQVEILRGPQSTLQGRNALAGAIVLRTADPTFEWSGHARASLTDEDAAGRLSIAGGGPLVADQVAFRVSLDHARADGLTRDPTLADDRADPRRSDTLRGKLLVTPEGAPGLRLLLSASHDYHRRGEEYSYTDIPDYWSDRRIDSDTVTYDRTRSDVVTLDAGYQFSPAAAVTSVTSWNRIRSDSAYDGDMTAAPLEYGGFSQNQATFSQELRLNWTGDRFNGLLGAYYSHLANGDERTNSVLTLRPDADLGLGATLRAQGLSPALAAYVVSLYPARIALDTRTFYPQTVRNEAVFGDGTFQLADRLKLIGGFRWDHEVQVRAIDNSVTLLTTLPNPAAYAGAGPQLPAIVNLVNGFIRGQVAQANSAAPASRTSFDAFLPKGGLSYELSDDAALSFVVQRGYRSGGSGANAARGRVYSYDPEYTWNYELALRSQWLDKRLTVNANAFYVDWTDQQAAVQLSGNIYDVEIRNAAASRVYGFELETAYRAMPNLDLYGSVGHANTRFDDFTVAGGLVTANLSGHQFANAPRWTAAAGATWRSDAGWFADVNANYRSAAYQDVADQAAHNVDGRTLVNGKAGWRGQRFGAYVTALNLFDTRYADVTHVVTGRNVAQLGLPRIVGAVLEANW